jgi:hypothetical protein
MSATNWLRSGSGIPTGGEKLEATYCRGNQSSVNHLPTLNPALVPLFGAAMFPGSLNLHASAPFELKDAATRLLANGEWQFAPVVIAETAVGVIARKSDTGPHRLLEVFGPRGIVTQLNLHEGQAVSIRILPGTDLFNAA